MGYKVSTKYDIVIVNFKDASLLAKDGSEMVIEMAAKQCYLNKCAHKNVGQ